MCNQYNGYTNYETWNVNLWLENDEGIYSMIKEWAEEADDIGPLSQQIQEFVEEMNPLASDSSMFSDLLGAAIGSVNWYEIAEYWFSEYHEDESEDEDEEVEDE